MTAISLKNSIIALLFSVLFFHPIAAQEFKLGAEKMDEYVPLLAQKRVAIVANQTTVIGKDKHLVDVLISKGVNLVKVFSPEHGFRGNASAGEKVADGKDAKTGLPIISLYGKNKKPSADMLADVDVVIFDIQDVGTRFYTYISTMSLVMEACAEQNKTLFVLDRPNPNGHYIDGPVLEPGFESFVGMHQVPVVHGMTVGEYALMVNYQGWLANNVRCDVKVIVMDGYNHRQIYSLPVAPSPNLPTDEAIRLYPSLCFFEATNVSVGRGTDLPFQQIGAPWMKTVFPDYTFVPKPNEGAKNPKYNGEICYGLELKSFANSFLIRHHKLYLFWLIEAYKMAPDQKIFFTSFMDKLAGTHKLQEQIEAGLDEDEIRATWQEDIIKFKQIRRKYLLYEDFE